MCVCIAAHEMVDMFDGVDNDALAIKDCNGKAYPHHWLGDGFCDCLVGNCPAGVKPAKGGSQSGGDFNCDTFRCDDGDCGAPGSCKVVHGKSGNFTIKVDSGWQKGELKDMAQHKFYDFQAHAGQTYWISTELETLEDSILYLMDKNLQSITQNDNAGRGTLASLIQWKCQKDGQYFIKVRSYNPTRRGTFHVQVSTKAARMPGTIPCLEGNKPEHSVTDCHGLNGGTCMFICKPGYKPTGRHYCNSPTGSAKYGKFTGGKCVPKPCTSGFHITRSPTTCSGTTGKSCPYICEKGYSKMGEHVCNDRGQFKGGGCVPKVCTGGIRLENSRTVCRGTVGDECTFICNRGTKEYLLRPPSDCNLPYMQLITA